MTAPQITPFYVDQTRMGGTQGARHGFNILPGPRWKTEQTEQGAPAASPTSIPSTSSRPSIPPPPSRIEQLGYGLMQAPELTEAEIKNIQKTAQPFVDAVQAELETVKLEAQAVSPEVIRENPDAYKSLNVIAPYFTPQEMRSQAILDAKTLQAEAGRALSGAISSYLTPTQATVLENVMADARDLVAYLNQFDLAPITGAKSKLSDDHLKERMAIVGVTLSDTEKMVVSKEAPSVPVTEDTGNPLGTILALGALAGVVWILAESL